MININWSTAYKRKYMCVFKWFEHTSTIRLVESKRWHIIYWKCVLLFRCGCSVCIGSALPDCACACMCLCRGLRMVRKRDNCKLHVTLMEWGMQTVDWYFRLIFLLLNSITHVEIFEYTISNCFDSEHSAALLNSIFMHSDSSVCSHVQCYNLQYKVNSHECRGNQRASKVTNENSFIFIFSTVFRCQSFCNLTIIIPNRNLHEWGFQIFDEFVRQ